MARGTSVGTPGKLWTKKHLDDLSTLGIGCCHLAGNYLSVRAVDGPAKKKKGSGSQRSDPATRIDRERKKKYEGDTVRLIMRPVKQTQLSRQQRETETVGLETHTLVPHLWIPIWGLLSGDTIVFPFRALILYARYCTRQTSWDTAALCTAELLIRKEKKGNAGTRTKN